MSVSIDDNFKEAIASFQAGRLNDAERCFKQVLRDQPKHVAALNLLSVLLTHLKRYDEAERYVKSALEVNSSSEATLYNYGIILKALKRPIEALERFNEALAINAVDADTWNNCGAVLNDLKHYDDAIVKFGRAIELQPNYAEAFSNKGKSLMLLGRYDEATTAYEKALTLKPDLAEAWQGRAAVFDRLNRREEALGAYNKALALKPDLAEAWQGLGSVLYDLMRYDEARAAYKRALILKPYLFKALNDLVSLLLSEGRIVEALDLARRAFATEETDETKSLFASCLCSPLVHPGVGDLRDLLVRAMSEAWTLPSNLALTATHFLVLNHAIRESMARAVKAWPKLLPAEELAGSSGLAEFAEDRLLRVLLEYTPVCEVGLERFTTGLRFTLLAAATAATDGAVAEPVLSLYCALARQCFINNYVFAQSDVEIEQTRALCDALVAALASEAAIPDLSLVAVASYVPLHTLPSAASLLDRSWPDAVAAVLTQQVRAPIEEQRSRALMPVLTAIEDDVSVQVRAQYEEHPYPQWVKMPITGKPETVDAFIRQRFPLSAFVELGKDDGVEILVAGCGTGQHPIGTVQKIKAAQLLAVDLSLTSLCYAQRQTRAFGLNNIYYAQADIMKLSSIGRTFDVIECVGVLHHLADPFAGWRVLLSMLRPGGIMLLGFYSDIARQNVVAARNFIVERGYRPTAEDIRRCRQELLACADDTPLRTVTWFRDFFSLSECRDLLFHVQEHRLTLPKIAEFIAANNLQLLGFIFDFDLQVRRNYMQQFPSDVAMTDLAKWHQYETENPRTFLAMYQFCVQKK
jgi:tetratricopeptide (TPR) repeat protein/SAM-dependent methyltransferase